MDGLFGHEFENARRSIIGLSRRIHEHGRKGWQKQSGYTRRALVETSINRFKRVIGHALRSQTEPRRVTETTLAIYVLNRMLELGCPKSARIA